MISEKFDVEIKPLETFATGVCGVRLGRMSIEKTFFGNLSAVSISMPPSLNFRVR